MIFYDFLYISRILKSNKNKFRGRNGVVVILIVI